MQPHPNHPILILPINHGLPLLLRVVEVDVLAEIRTIIHFLVPRQRIRHNRQRDLPLAAARVVSLGEEGALGVD